uniref:NADP-dependent oxidoreductase domain-containing protein n=1 Tax=Oryza glumipatula TaxID=40148 RepID=A0A0E0B764_9ORYZ
MHTLAACVVPALRRTLRNLQMEYIDLYLVHFPLGVLPECPPSAVFAKEDLVVMDMEGVWREMEECQMLGLTKAIGASNFTCKKLDSLLYCTKQVEVHPYCRQDKLREFCKGKGIQMCAYSPLGANGTSWCSKVMDCPLLKQIALERGKTVCLRWVYEQGNCIIVKSFNERRLRENLGIFDWELTDVDHQKISTLLESRGCLDFFVHESGPYKTVDEFWDGEITGDN